MFYIDVTFEDKEYRGVYLKEYRPNHSGANIARNFDCVQQTNGYEKDTVYWFKYEPLKWIQYEENYTSHYLCLNVIDAEPMFNGDSYNKKDDGANTFFKNESALSKWLKGEFTNVAFSKDDIPYLQVTILSKEELLKHFPLKKERMPRPTDYALIKGYLPDLLDRGNDIPFVWTSTYIEGYNRMVSIAKDGSIIDFYSENHGYISYIYGGVQPAFRIIDNSKKIPPQNKFNLDFDKLEDKRFNDHQEQESKSRELDVSEIEISDDDLPF